MTILLARCFFTVPELFDGQLMVTAMVPKVDRAVAVHEIFVKVVRLVSEEVPLQLILD